jgi:hypothetical protein
MRVDARIIIEPQPPAFRLSGRYLSPSRRQMRCTRLALTRQPSARSNGDAAIAIASVVLASRIIDVLKGAFVIAHTARFSLGRAWLADSPAGAAFRDVQPLLQMRDALASAFRA